MNQSEQFNNSSYQYYSLCERCRTENEYEQSWSCNDENKTPFIRAKNFLKGESLCTTGRNPDCIYKYNNNKIIIIEIKDQKIKNIIDDVLIEKIKNSNRCVSSKNIEFKSFVLLVSSIENSSKKEFQMLLILESLFNKHHFKLCDNNVLISKKDNIKTKFFVKKCKDIDERFFTNICS